MRGSILRAVAVWAVVVAALMAVGVSGVLLADEDQAPGQRMVKKLDHVPEVAAMLSDLKVDEPRTHKNMIVFPIRWSGTQAEGNWVTLDEAVTSGELKVTEKSQATVPQVQMENTGSKTVVLMSGEIIRGGKQTRVVRHDTIIEAKQRVDVPVFCVEQSRWAGESGFTKSGNMAPAAVQGMLKRGADQGTVWGEVRRNSARLGVQSQTHSLDEVLESGKVQGELKKAHDDLGNFSPPDTVGLAFADARTGRVVGLELFGCRALFAKLQAKLIEGYTTDLVIGHAAWDRKVAKEVTRKDVEAFIGRARAGSSKYEDTPGSGRGIDLVSGTLKGKGVVLGRHGIHLSIQDVMPTVTPARPIVNEPPQRPRVSPRIFRIEPQPE